MIVPVNVSAEEVALLARSDIAAAMSHPNIDPRLWLKHVGDYPIEALSNPSLLLWRLEDPVRFSEEALLREHVETWLYLEVKALPAREGQLFAADCVEHAMVDIMPTYTENARAEVYAAIQARRDYANGLALWRAWQDATQRFSKSWVNFGPGLRWNVIYALTQESAWATVSSTWYINDKIPYMAEQAWQWSSLLPLAKAQRCP